MKTAGQNVDGGIGCKAVFSDFYRREHEVDRNPPPPGFLVLFGLLKSDNFGLVIIRPKVPERCIFCLDTLSAIVAELC